MDITGFDKAVVLAALFNNASPRGLGLYVDTGIPMTVEEAQELIEKNNSGAFDYVRGRSLKVYFRGNELSVRGYDRDYGQGSAEKVILQAVAKLDKTESKQT